MTIKYMWKSISILIILIIVELVCQASAASQSYLPRADLIKGSGPEVYVLENGTRHWIPDIETFNEFRFKWENIKTYADTIINNYPQDDDWSRWDDYPEGSLLKGSGPSVYLIELGKRRWIPSPAIFNGNNFGWKYILEIDDDDLDDYDLGANLTLNESNRYPETVITSGPDEGEVLEMGDVEFRYSGTNPLGLVSDLSFETYLRGYDNQWRNQGSNYIEDYDLSDESGRNYIFYVRAKNKQGYYDPTPASRSFQLGVSPYYKKVEIDELKYEEDDFKNDYIVLSNESDQIINVTGWTIQTKLASLDIPQAVKKLKSPFTSASNVDINLAPDDQLIISIGLSPIGKNFLANKCTGYLDQDSFTPSLDNNCPYIDSSEYSEFNAYCRDFIDDLNRCELPNYVGNVDIGGDSQCTSFINQKLNYDYCYSNYYQDPDFYEDEWRVFLGRTSRDIFSNVSDTIILYDQNGLKVDEYYYD